IEARAIPLEGATRAASAALETSPRRRSRVRRAALLLAVVALLAAALGVAGWRFPEQVAALPFVGKLLPAAFGGSQSGGQAERAVEPEKVLPPLQRKAAPGDEKRADVLEERAAELLLAGKSRR